MSGRVGQYRCKCKSLLACAVVVFVLTGCGLAAEKSEFAGPDWSRGKLLGIANINNRPGIAWDAQNKCAILTWLTKAEGQWHFQYVRINDQGEIASSQPLALPLRQPSHPKLLRDSQGIFHLFWLDRERDGRPGVYHARLTAEGEALSEPGRLSGAEGEVSGYAVVEAMPGVLDLFWSDVAMTPSELNHARIQASGERIVVPHTLGANGQHPSCAMDANGTIHLTWHRTETLGGEQVFYATFDPQSLDFSEPVMLAALPGGTGLTFYPSEIGLDSRHVYILWSQEHRGGGTTPGTAQTYCQTFPIGNPAAWKGGTLDIPGSARPQYASMSGAFNYQRLAWLGEVSGLPGVYKEYVFFPSVPSMEYGPAGASQAGVDKDFVYVPEAPGDPSDRLRPGPILYRLKIEYTYMPCPIPGQREEVGIVISAMMAQSESAEGLVQIAFVVMKDGQWKGLEVAGITRSASMRPVAVADDQGAIHLAWLDAGGFGRYEVYYASTAPLVKAAINRLTIEDVLASLVTKTWRAAAAFSFFPVLILWLFLPFAWLVIFHFFRPDSDLRTRTGWVGLTIAVLLYVLSKMLAVPAFLRYAPFLDAVAPQFEDGIVFGFPLLIAAISLLLMGVYIRRSDRKATWLAFVLFAATDSLISLVLYIPNVISI